MDDPNIFQRIVVDLARKPQPQPVTESAKRSLTITEGLLAREELRNKLRKLDAYTHIDPKLTLNLKEAIEVGQDIVRVSPRSTLSE